MSIVGQLTSNPDSSEECLRVDVGVSRGDYRHHTAPQKELRSVAIWAEEWYAVEDNFDRLLKHEAVNTNGTTPYPKTGTTHSHYETHMDKINWQSL